MGFYLYCPKDDCFANHRRINPSKNISACTCLEDNDFGGRECPFYNPDLPPANKANKRKSKTIK